jgi:Mandelate racemase / muconate lactonizing enzyme, N-terminal domain
MDGSPRLHVRDVQARAVVGPLAAPVRTASGSVTQALLVLIDLHTEEGPVGRAYLFAYQPFALRPLRDLVLGLGETLKGSPSRRSSCTASCAGASRCSAREGSRGWPWPGSTWPLGTRSPSPPVFRW